MVACEHLYMDIAREKLGGKKLKCSDVANQVNRAGMALSLNMVKISKINSNMSFQIFKFQN